MSTLQRIRGLCDNPECRRKDVGFQQERRRGTTMELIRHRLPASWPANAAVAVLPRNSRQLVPIDVTRVEALRQHLERIVIEAEALPDAECESKETSATTHGVEPQQAEMPALAAACGLCAGHCCATGGDSAWLEPTTIRRLQRQLPPLAAPRIIGHYLDYVPETGYQDSCIYHAENGCRLPRQLRSNVCNQYLCKGLAEIVQGLEGSAEPCVTATVIGVSPVSVALIDALGVLDIIESTGG
ncbi:hypothetical protein NP590_11665 [Methylomonas sp. SURF-2]|uniref:YkgJ family cysteine cluster protein n=1 Tax=Methylomonas subterranea TaxID=2952225 RepID=A0ABT1TH23_9GAMM|nr:hypothetical protein [Methylomonas sp. SURF-2]MCQ8104765.1 hypothetical protein [Methylomonas sp. SURF-2]